MQSNSSESESTTELASGVISAAGDAVSVELIRSQDIPAAERTIKPAYVKITWPDAPSVFTPERFPDAAAYIVKLFSEAHIALAALKARRRTS